MKVFEGAVCRPRDEKHSDIIKCEFGDACAIFD